MPSFCRSWFLELVAVVALLAAPIARAQQTPAGAADAKSPAKGANPAHSEMAYLGIDVDSLHPSLASHVPEALAHGQGVVVNYVEPNSPAAKAGLKEHDVLTAYDDQKLFAPEQLAKLVQADKPERAVALDIVRGGKSQKLSVTLGQRPQSQGNQQSAWEPRLWDDWRWHFPEQLAFRASQPMNSDGNWESFDSLTLRKTGDNKFKVEIQYLDKAGKTQRHAFEGTREEIRRDIEAEKDLPASERSHLLSGLGMSGSDFDRSAQFWNSGPWGRY